MTSQGVSARRLMIKLAVYFVLLFGGIISVVLVNPDVLALMPIGGTDAMEIAGIGVDDEPLQGIIGESSSAQDAKGDQRPTARQIGLVSVYLAFSLGGTILVMLPITWTYIATKIEIGYRRSFVRALIVLPICAATIVLLIQNNLALAFGLAAMVAAIRFRVVLQEAIDGVYIFSSICVGLAAGIGYLGAAAIMAVFFCYTNAVLWVMEFGKNPIDDARIAKKRDRLD